MPALSTGTYGKAHAMPTGHSDFADGVTAALENAHAAIDELDKATRTGGPVPQGAVNTLRRVVQDLGEITTNARRQAADDASQQRQDDDGSYADDGGTQKTAGQQQKAGDSKDTAGKGPAPAKP